MIEINGCYFIEDLLYDENFFIWFKEKDLNIMRIGITNLFSFYLGKIKRINVKPIGVEIDRNKNLCTLESSRRFEGLRLPFKCKIISVNPEIIKNPKIINDDPYDKGWIMEIFLAEKIEMDVFEKFNHEEVRRIIDKLNIKCFKAVPDHFMYEIGVECAAVISKLNELFNKIEKYEIVLLVSDDPTAYVEIVRWTDKTKNLLLDYRKENNFWYFLIKKI